MSAKNGLIRMIFLALGMISIPSAGIAQETPQSAVTALTRIVAAPFEASEYWSGHERRI